MKKIFVLAALAALVSTSAIAGYPNIAMTKHNLAISGTNSFESTNLDEICAFCHTPHASNTAAVAFKAPLWNRSLTRVGAGNVALTTYVNANSLSATATAAANINASDAVLCLSCHDGYSLGGALINNPNSLAAAVAVNGELTGAGNIGTVLTNDHPVGFNYASAKAEDTELNDVTTVGTKSANAVKFFNNDLWCSSCHDVHNNTNAPFLVMSNTGSALCLACHNK